jgi:hypothetical protein
MNPLITGLVYKSESSIRARKYRETWLLNQAHPRRDRSTEGAQASSSSRRSWVRGISRRLHSWIPSRQPHAVNPAESTQAPG